jgi:pimeloyl-ACP methyl ester carboxylesterase
VIHALQQESSEALLWEDLSKFECPALIVRGGQPDSLLTAEESEMYQRYLRYAEIVVLEESGHTLWEPNPDQLLGTLQTFLSQIDDRRSGRPFLGVNTGGTGE